MVKPAVAIPYFPWAFLINVKEPPERRDLRSR